MKAIIDGIRYDIDKAEQIGKSNNYLIDEQLYCGKKNGKFFLITYGTDNSCFIDTIELNKQKIDSIYIIPISREKAFGWLFKNDQIDVIMNNFSDLISHKELFEKFCKDNRTDLAEKYFPDLIEDA